MYGFRKLLAGETSKKGRTSGGLPYGVYRGLILREIKIGQDAKADGTHVGRRKVLQVRRRDAEGCCRSGVP